MSDNNQPSGPKGPKRDRFPPPPRPGDRKERPEGSGKKPGGGRFDGFSRSLAFWVIFIMLTVMGYQLITSGGGDEIEITYNEFTQLVDAGQVDELTIVANTQVEGGLSTPINRQVGGVTRTYRSIKVTLPEGIIDKEMLEHWTDQGITYTFESEDVPWVQILFSTLPWLLLIVFWIFMMRQMQGGQRGVFSFGKSKAKLLTGGKVQVNFNDVAGADEAKQELQEVIEFLKDPGKFQKLGGRIPKGVLLLGPPGTGKTLLARAVAGEAGVPFFSLSGSDFVEMFVGVGASRVRDLFEQGKSSAPCIIFIDELDAVGRHRGAGLGGGHDEREQTLNALLVEMDGFESNDGVILIAATNRPDVLDPALLRPGRFDRQVVVDLPDVNGREGILKVHTRNIPLHKDVDLKIVARTTPGLSGADLANLVNEAALLAARFDREAVGMADFEEAKDKVMMGTERRSMVIRDEEKRKIAYHESGHALIGKLVKGSDPVHKVTIIPRGRALGLTHYLPIDDRHIHGKEYLVGKIKHLLAGRTAELLIFDEVTTGAGNDIQRASEIARKMVQEWGMSERVGPLHYGDDQQEIFLGKAMAQHKERSEKMAELIDEEVKHIVETAASEVERLLKKNIEGLKNLAETLLEYEILSGPEIDLAIEGRPLGREPGEPEAPSHMSREALSAGAPEEASEREGEEPPQQESPGEEPSEEEEDKAPPRPEDRPAPGRTIPAAGTDLDDRPPTT
ncbi:MAG: ATP-dependent zinc metalloprotease FtsH [bacterium]